MNMENVSLEKFTVSRVAANRRAPVDKLRLFEGLERIVNVRDSMEDYLQLRITANSLFPMSVREAGDIDQSVEWQPATSLERMEVRWTVFI